MATNKHATIRYHALDRCFSNIGRKFFIQDLIDSCNSALYDYTGKDINIQRRQIFDDINFMESEQGWSIPLDRIKEGRKVYYRYSDPKFTIKEKGITQYEAEQLKDSFSILSRFQGLPQFEWIEETLVRIQDTFYLKGDKEPKIGFDENPYLKGLNHYRYLFEAISGKQTLTITYKGFHQSEAEKFVFHPWYLKQYNNRWFIFGWNEKYTALSNLAIDRIISIQDSKKEFKSNQKINFQEYFEDVIGVTVNPDNPPERILILVENQLWPYIENKPLHGSQSVKERTNDGVIIQLEVQINHELLSLLFSHMERIKILEPIHLKETVKIKIKALLNKYI